MKSSSKLWLGSIVCLVAVTAGLLGTVPALWMEHCTVLKHLFRCYVPSSSSMKRLWLCSPVGKFNVSIDDWDELVLLKVELNWNIYVTSYHFVAAGWRWQLSCCCFFLFPESVVSSVLTRGFFPVCTHSGLIQSRTSQKCLLKDQGERQHISEEVNWRGWEDAIAV